MKCPHCSFEREVPFKFCPMCGVKMVDKADEENFSAENQPQTEETPVIAEKIAVQPEIATFVRRVPHGFTEKTYNERKGIKKISRLSATSFLLLSFISIFISYVSIFTLLGFGYTFDSAVDFLQDPFFAQLYQITVSSFMFIVPFTIIFKFAGYKISKIINFNLPKTKAWFPLVLIGIGFCAFANIATSIAATFFESFGIKYEVDFGENPQGILGIILSILATAVVPALVEEFACRGVVMGALRKYGDGFAVLTSAIMFGLIHGNFQQMPFAFMVGLVLGFVTVKCNSIWPAVLIHFYNNFSSVVFDYAFEGVAVQLQNIIYTIYIVICLFIGLIGVLLLRNNTEIFKFTTANTESGEKNKYKWFFLTELTIFAIVVYLIESLQFFVS